MKLLSRLIEIRVSACLMVMALVLSVSSCSSSDVADALSDAGQEVADDVIGLAIKTGRFIDSPVSGLRYTTTSGFEDVTNSLGEFQYRENDVIEFFIGDTFSLGSVVASDKLTPFDLVGFKFDSDDLDLEDLLVYRLEAQLTDSVTDFESAVNRLILLQSLDRNHNPDDGIQIDTAVASFFTTALVSILFQQNTDNFVAAFLVLFLDLVSQGILSREDGDLPVSEEAALIHFLNFAL